MRHFLVIVRPKRVEVSEEIEEVLPYDCCAIVDGEKWRYQIKKDANIAKNDKHWRSRAFNLIFYHAHNSGTVVKFEPVHVKKRRKRAVSPKQLSLFD